MLATLISVDCDTTCRIPYLVVSVHAQSCVRVLSAGVVPSLAQFVRGSGHSGPCVSFSADLFAIMCTVHVSPQHAL